MRRKMYIASVIIAIVFTFCGCNTKTIKIDPIPELKTGSPLAGIEPLSFKINEFEDIRPYKKFVGTIANYGIKIELEDQAAPEIIMQAFANELKRNGHKVIGLKESGKADVVIDGVIRQYWVEQITHVFNSKITGIVEVEINVSGQGSTKSLPKTYRGESYGAEKPFQSLTSVWQEVINQALIEAIKEFSTDEELMNMLKSKRKGS